VAEAVLISEKSSGTGSFNFCGKR